MQSASNICAHTQRARFALPRNFSPVSTSAASAEAAGGCIFQRTITRRIFHVPIWQVVFSIAALLVFAGASCNVRADTITVVGVDSGQFSTATVVCEFNSATNTFTFTITNTSAITQPGSTSTITGIGFDLPPIGKCECFRTEWLHAECRHPACQRISFFRMATWECAARV